MDKQPCIFHNRIFYPDSCLQSDPDKTEGAYYFIISPTNKILTWHYFNLCFSGMEEMVPSQVSTLQST